jgi:hypothetical protein
MIRNIAAGAGALALAAAVLVPVTASAVVTGNVTCTLKGSASIAPGLPLESPGAVTKKKLKTTVTFNGTLTDCTGVQTGTKKGAQIEAGTISGKAKTITEVGAALPSCVGLTAQTTPTVLKTTVKFTNAGKTSATSKVNLTIGDAQIDSTLKVAFPSSGPVSGGNAFKAQNLTATAILDKTAADLATLCTGGASTTFNFSGVQGGSTLETP